MTGSLRFIYLHGFASGPGSRKARFFADQFQRMGLEMQVPDLAEANFENLTITAQLLLIDKLVNNRPVALIGSSLGGYLASLYAATHPEVEKMVLLAPAFGFVERWRERLGPVEMERWQRTGQLSVYHYGDRREQNLRFGFIADASRFPLVPDFSQPALILHGNSDDVVPVTASQDFVNSHPNARLVRLESDHELGNVLETLWGESARFLLGASLAK